MASEKRQTKLTMDLGGESIELISLEATESLSQHFIITLELLLKSDMDLLPHLGKPATVAVSEDDHFLRNFNGIIVDAELVREVNNVGFVHRMTLRPAAYLHSQGRDFKIFQNMTAKAIIQQIFEECGIQAELKRAGDTPNRAYCVQYGESNFGFASRLMEEEGLYYFYEHGDDAHVLTICDSPSSHKEGTASPLKYKPTSAPGGNVNSATHFASHTMYVHSWHERVSTGGESKVTLWDFDFMQPDKARQSDYSLESAHKLDEIEVYDFPGRYFVEATGVTRSTALLESRRAARRTFTGGSANAAISSGTTFKLREHPNDRFNANFLVTHCHHSIATEQHYAGMTQEAGTEVHFESVPAETKWRAPLDGRGAGGDGPGNGDRNGS